MAQSFEDEAGIERLRGTLKGLPASGIPQGGPLTTALVTGANSLIGSGTSIGTAALRTNPPPNADDGGSGDLDGGRASGGRVGAQISAAGGTLAADGLLMVKSGGGFGAIGSALVRVGAPDASGRGGVKAGGVIVGNTPPVAAPDGFLPFAVDTTPVTGGLYAWSISDVSWIKVSALP